MKDFYISRNNCYMAGITPEDIMVIPETFEFKNIQYRVVGIQYPGFKDCNALTTVILPNSISYIEESSFSNCRNLERIKLSSNIDIIPKYMFYGCKKLESLILPSGVKEIATHSIYGCKSLTEVTIPASVKAIRQFAFNVRRSWKINFPGTITDWYRLNKEGGWDLSPFGCEVKCSDGQVIEDM